MTEYSPAKTGEYPRIFPNFQNCARCEKDLKDNKDNSRHFGRKYARIFVLGHYLSLVAHSFPRAKTVRFSEKIMPADKYPSIFSRQMATIVYLSPSDGPFDVQTHQQAVGPMCQQQQDQLLLLQLESYPTICQDKVKISGLA